MRRSLTIFIGTIALATLTVFHGPSAFAQEDGANQYNVEMQVFEITVPEGSRLMTGRKPGVTMLWNDVEDGEDLKTTWTSGSGIAIGQATVIFDGPRLQFHSGPETMGHKGPITLVAYPTLTTIEGQEASIRIGGEGVEFFHRREDGLFEFKKSNTFLGYAATLTVNPNADAASHVKADFQFNLTQVTGRDPIEGVSLPVGKPHISNLEISSVLDLELGKWLGTLYPRENEPRLLIAMKVTEVSAESAATSGLRHSIESKIFRISEGAGESLRARDWPGTTRFEVQGSMSTDNQHWQAVHVTLPQPASMEAFEQSFSHLVDPVSWAFAYRIKRDTFTDEFAPVLEKVGAELVSAPRVTIQAKSPDTMFKVVVGGGFGGGDSSGHGFGTGGGGGGFGGAITPSSGDYINKTFNDLGLSPDVTELIADNLGSSAMIADINSNDETDFYKGIALAFAVEPDSERGAVDLSVATHYRLHDHTMERKGLLGRLKPVHAGIADLQMKHTESLMPDEALVIYQRMPHSGDSLLTFITVEEVRQRASRFYPESD
jgi:hypothetical protein